MIYEEPMPMERSAAQQALRSNISVEVCQALLSSVFHDPDWQWVQEQCLECARHSSNEVRGVAAIALGHLARIHRTLDLQRVLPVLEELRKDPSLAGRVEDALDDIETYIGRLLTDPDRQ